MVEEQAHVSKTDEQIKKEIDKKSEKYLLAGEQRSDKGVINSDDGECYYCTLCCDYICCDSLLESCLCFFLYA